MIQRKLLLWLRPVSHRSEPAIRTWVKLLPSKRRRQCYCMKRREEFCACAVSIEVTVILRDGCNFKESNRSGQNIMKNQSYLWKYLYSGVLRIVRPTSWKTINDCKIYFSHHNSSKITQQECKRNLNTVSRRKHETLSKSSTRPIENCAISHTKKLI